MKTLLYSICLAGLFMSCQESQTSSESQNPEPKIEENNTDTTVVTKTRGDRKEPWLALRKTPDSESELLGMLPDGSILITEEIPDNSNWVKVKMLHTEGFVNKYYLQKATGTKVLPPVDVTPPRKLKDQISRRQKRCTFKGEGTEPFWNIYLTKGEMLYEDIGLGILESFAIDRSFVPGSTVQTIDFRNNEGGTGQLIIKMERGSNGMSDDSYPYSVEFTGSLGHNWGGGLPK